MAHNLRRCGARIIIGARTLARQRAQLSPNCHHTVCSPLPVSADARRRDGAVLLAMVVMGLFAVGLLLDSVTTQTAKAKAPSTGTTPIDGGVLAPDPGIDDAFDRADSTVSLGSTATGAQWQPTGGAWGVNLRQAYVAQAGKSVAIATLRGGTADGRVSVTAAKMAPGFGLVFRCRSALNCWRVEAVPQFGTWNVIKIENGNETKVADLGTVSVADGTEIAVDMNGSVLTFFINGERVTAVDDATFKDDDAAGLSLREPASAPIARWSKFAVAVVKGAGIVDVAKATFYDRFDRGDGEVLGEPWNAVKGKWAVKSKRAQVTESVTLGANLALVEAASADGIVQATIYRPQQTIGIAFRCQDASNCWRIEAAVGFGTWNVTKVVNGTVTKVGTLGIQPTSAGTTVSVQLTGNQAIAYINGVEALKFDVNELSDETGVGLVVETDPLATTAKWSEFIVAPLGARS